MGDQRRSKAPSVISLNDLQQAELRVEQPRCSLQRDQHFQQHGDLRRQADAVAVDDVDHLFKCVRQDQLVQRLCSVMGDVVGQLGLQCRSIHPRWHLADPLDQTRQLNRIALDHGQQQVLHVFPQSFVNSPHHPEVEQSDAVTGQDENISGMRIRVVETVRKDHLQVQVGSTTSQRLPVAARRR